MTSWYINISIKFTTAEDALSIDDRAGRVIDREQRASIWKSHYTLQSGVGADILAKNIVRRASCHVYGV